MIINTANLTTLQVGFQKRFQAAYALYDTEHWWNLLATEIPSTTSIEEYGWMDDIPELREWVGERQVQNHRELGYSLKNKDYELTLKVERNKIEDDKFGMYGPQVDMMGMKAARKPDSLVLDALAAGESALCYDGQPFFNGSHPKKIGDSGAGTQSNLVTSSALTHANYTTRRAEMRAFVGASGKPLGIRPTKLVVGPELEGVGKSILEADLIALAASSATSNAGITNVNKNTAKLVVIDEMAGTDWYLVDDRLPIKPLIFQNRQSPRFDALFNRNDPNTFWSKEFVYGVDMRCAAGYALWFLMMKCKA